MVCFPTNCRLVKATAQIYRSLTNYHQSLHGQALFVYRLRDEAGLLPAVYFEKSKFS